MDLEYLEKSSLTFSPVTSQDDFDSNFIKLSFPSCMAFTPETFTSLHVSDPRSTETF